MLVTDNMIGLHVCRPENSTVAQHGQVSILDLYLTYRL